MSRQSLDLVADVVEGTAAVREPWAVELRRSASDDPAMLLEQQLKAGRPLDATGGTGMKAARRRFGERREVDRYSGERALMDIGTIAGLEGCRHVQPRAGTILRGCTPTGESVVHQTELLLSQW